MAQQVRARIKGDDYQHLFSWHHCLGLLIPETEYQVVTIENDLAGSVDDVTVEFDRDSGKTSTYYQLKFHVDQRSSYSTTSLIAVAKISKTSLLKKFYDTWIKLKGPEGKCGELYLVSNWGFDSTDNLKKFVSGDDFSFTGDFFKGSLRSHAGQIRKCWAEHLGIYDDQIKEFCKCLRLKVGFASTESLVEIVSERMSRLSLETTDASMTLAIGSIRNLIKNDDRVLDRDKVLEIIEKTNMQKTDSGRTTVHMNSIIRMKYETRPDYSLDWTDLFEGDAEVKGHRLRDQNHWETRIKPDLVGVKESFIQNSPTNIITFKGQARLSCWFAAGFIFPSVGNFTLEIKQRDDIWISNVDYTTAKIEAVLATENISGQEINKSGDTLAVGISISGDLSQDVLRHIQSNEPNVRSLLLIEPQSGTGGRSIASNEDAIKFALEVKTFATTFAKHHNLQKMQIYFYGPLSVAGFIGHNFNAVCKEVQIMENDGNEYLKSILLSSP